RVLWGLVPRNEANVATGFRLAESSIRLAPRDEWAHFCLAFAHELAGSFGDGVVACERAIELNPNFSAGYAELARKYSFLGQSEQAIKACDWALRLNSRDPANWERHSTLAIAHFVAADDEAALREARATTQLRPDFPEGWIMFIAAASALDK